MKTQKLIVITAIVCLLVWASGIAMAQDSTCPRGIISDETLNNVVVDGTSCFITESVIEGNVIVRNSPWFGMTANRVLGEINITGSTSVFLKDNLVSENPVIANQSVVVWVADNRIDGSSTNSYMSFDGNTAEVLILNNNVSGDLLCADNEEVLTRGNIVRGRDECRFQ